MTRAQLYDLLEDYTADTDGFKNALEVLAEIAASERDAVGRGEPQIYADFEALAEAIDDAAQEAEALGL